MQFTKGHGTQNDFVVLEDPNAQIELSPARVAALCDRQQGLGADGVLRVAKAGVLLSAGVLDVLPPGVAAEHWFMDYRNGDGSIAEMCGNGVRVFAHYLHASGRESSEKFVVGSRAGARPVIIHSANDATADVTVDMGRAVASATSEVTLGGRTFTGIAVDVGNPHLACVTPSLSQAQLAQLDFTTAIHFDAVQFPGGVNIEILTAPTEHAEVAMRVHERGVGETRSCGTGTVAAALAALAYQGVSMGSMKIDVPGGQVLVTITESTSYLRGPSVLVASGSISEQWWAALPG
ncbi:MAG: diaminopimelate epimerase [Mycobacteriaceae bacterium]